MTTLQEERFYWNLNLANGKFAEFEFTYYYIFRNLTMIAYKIKIQKLLIIESVNLTNVSQADKLNSVYIFIQ